MNKTLLKSVREYKKQSILAPLLVILEVLMEVLIPLEMAKIIDVGIANGDMSYILQRGLILVVMAMLALFFGVQAGNMAAIAGAGYARNLRHDIFYKVQDFSFKNIDHFSTSGLVTRMTTDITNIQMAYMMSIRLLARAPFMIILSWIMTLLLNKTISLLFLIVIPLLGGTLIYIAKKAHPHFIKVFDEYDVLNNSVQENVNASRVVKAFVREDYEIDKFHDISKYVYNLFTKAEKIVAWNSPVMQFTMYSVVLIMVLIGGKSIIAGTMETGELTSVIVYALQIIGSLMMVTFVFVMIMIAEASSDRITEVMNEIPEMQDQPDAVTEVPNGDIVFDHVGFAYRSGETVLKEVSFTARQGEVTALVGPSGGGKTTVSRLAARFWDIDKGKITVGGMDVTQIEPESLLSLYSIVFQDVTLFNNTIMENIRIGRKDATDEEVIAAARLANCEEFASQLPDGYQSMIGENGCELSGGERQRISIARAFLKDAPIILLDEATASLDVENETLIQAALSRLIQHKTVLVIAHRMRTVSGADKVVVLADGVVAEQGSPSELMDTGKIYSHMVELQAMSQEWGI